MARKVKPKKPAGSLAEAKRRLWADIRNEFETTPVGIRELARLFGIKSHATIKRRVDSEGWKRHLPSISANLVTEALLDTLEENAAAGLSDPAKSAGNQPVENSKDSAESGNSSKPQPPGTGGSLGQMSPNPKAGTLSYSEQPNAVRAAKRMASAQADQMRKEVALADATITFSAGMLKVLQAVLDCEDPAEINRLIGRFMIGKQESFSGLMKAAVSGVEKGVALRRRALGMGERAAFGQNSTPIAPADLPEQVQMLLPTLSTEHLMDLRRAADLLKTGIERAPAQQRMVIEHDVADAALGVSE